MMVIRVVVTEDRPFSELMLEYQQFRTGITRVAGDFEDETPWEHAITITFTTGSISTG